MKKSIAAAVLIALTVPLALHYLRPPQADPHAGHAQAKARYQCSMHPEIVSDKPGNCPICGMRLSRVEESTPEAESPAAATAPPSGVPGHANFSLSAERQQLIGVRTTVAALRPLTRRIRAPGRIAHDPDLYNAATEYRQALEAAGSSQGGPQPEVRQRADELLRSAEIRLRQLGLSGAQLQELVRSSEALTGLIVPGHGGSAWFFLQVYQSDLGLVEPGQKVRASSQSLPGRNFTGTVMAIDTMLDPETRSVRVRARLDQVPAALAHEVYLDAEIEVPLGMVLAVPEDAVLDTGENRIVFVRKGGRDFEPRDIRLGRSAEGWYEVLGGLSKGEEIVTSANFLIDSESRFKSAVAAFGAGGGHKH